MQINPRDFEVLVCGKEGDHNKSLIEAVNRWGYKVVNVVNDLEALRYLKEHELPHIVIADMDQSKVGVYEFVQAIKSHSSEIEVLLLSQQKEASNLFPKQKVFHVVYQAFRNLPHIQERLMFLCQQIHFRFYSEFADNYLVQNRRAHHFLENLNVTLEKAKSIQELTQAACRSLSDFLDGAIVVYFQYFDKSQSMAAGARFPYDLFARTQPKMQLSAKQLKSQSSIYAWFKKAAGDEEFQLLLDRASKLDPVELQLQHKGFWRSISLGHQSTPRGLFVFKTSFWMKDLHPLVLLQFSKILSLHYELILTRHKMANSATKDWQSQLFNVRYFEERLAAECKRSSRLKLPATLLGFAVEHLEDYKRSCSKADLNKLELELAAFAREHFRASDVVSILSKNRYMALMPDTTMVGALRKVELLQKALVKKVFHKQKAFPLRRLTMSFSVGVFPLHGNNSEELLQSSIRSLEKSLAGQGRQSKVVVADSVSGHVPLFS